MTAPTECNELILLPSLTAQRGPRGGLVLTRKYLNGAAEYARYWPGPVTSLVHPSDRPTSDMDHVEILPGEAETGLEIRPRGEGALAQRLSRAAAALAFLCPDEVETAQLCRGIGVPLIFTSEYSPRTERQIIDAEVANPLRRWRRKVWTWQAERKRQEGLRIAAGVQCSGTPTYDIYRHFNANALLFFDNRVPRAGVVSEQELAAKLAVIREGTPLRLAFGGRLIAMKGVLELPKLANDLRRLGVPFTLDIYGGGSLEDRLRAEISGMGLSSQVALRGVLDFQSEWLPVLKHGVDLFVCCHPQGDPSSTYPEVMSCGVPIAGFDNEAFVGIVAHSGGGWLSPINDAGRLARLVMDLHRNRDELIRGATSARTFALKHSFEDTFSRRTAHLVRLSRLPERLKEQTAA